MSVENRSRESRPLRLGRIGGACAALTFVALVAVMTLAPQATSQGEPDAARNEVMPVFVERALSPETAQFTAALPNGISVELLGVSSHPSTDGSWWRPDGSALTEPPCDRLTSSVRSDPGAVDREFAVQLGNLPAEPVGEQVLFDPAFRSYAGQDHPKRLGKDVKGLRAMAVSLPDRPTVTVRVGVAAGPWQTIGESERGSVSTGTARGGCAFSPVIEKDGQVILTVSHNVMGSEDRLVAVDKDGKEHPAGYWSKGGAIGFRQLTARFANLSLNDIKTFRLQTRPYQWVAFDNVSLQAGKKTDVQILGPDKDESAKQEASAAALPVSLSLEDNARAEVAITLGRDKELTKTLPGTVRLDLTTAGNGRHYLFFHSPGYASQWQIVEVANGKAHPEQVKVKLFRKRYVVLRCAFNTRGGRNLEGDGVEEQRIAVGHWAAPKHFGEDWQVWQKSGDATLFGETPWLEFHRYSSGFGFAKPAPGTSYAEMKEAPEAKKGPEAAYRCKNMKAEEGLVLYCRVNGDSHFGRGYGKILVEAITETPPKGVQVVETR